MSLVRIFRLQPDRRTLLVTSLIHLLNDACFALLYPIMPFIAADLNLSYAQVGLLKTVFSGSASMLQLPAGFIGERFGELLVLLLGNAWVGAGLAAMAFAAGYPALLLLALAAGIGGNAQHPLASSIVSRVYDKQRVATALGTLNFAGDLGKLLGPLIVGVIVVQWEWRVALLSVGLITAFLSIAMLFLKRTEPSQQASASAETRAVGQLSWQFVVLLIAGSLDSATRGAALTFLPFVFSGQGMSAVEISLLFGFIFAAGALGKFLCGWLGDRWGIVAVIITTELITAGSLAGFLTVALPLSVPLAVVFGFSLNGTSSALMTAVTHFVPAHRRARGFGIYFTATLVSSAIAPLAYGVLGDHAGLPPVFLVMAAMTAVIVPVILPIRRTLSPAH